MIYYLSGGGQPWVPEMQTDDPGVCLSYYENVVARKNKKANIRLVNILAARKASKLKENKSGEKGKEK